MPRDVPPSALESEVKRNGRDIQGLSVRVETLDQSFDTRLDRIAEGLEALTQQVGRLSEATYETQSLLREAADRRDRQIDKLLDQQATKLDRIFDAIQAQNRSIDNHLRVAEAQSSNIAALTQLVQMLVSRN